MGVLRRDGTGPVGHLVRAVFRALGGVADRDVTRMRDRALELALEYRDTRDVRADARPAGAADHVRVQGGRVGRGNSTGTWTGSGRAGSAGRSCSSAGRWEQWSSGEAGRSTCWTTPAGAGSSGGAMITARDGVTKFHLAAGRGLRDGGQDRPTRCTSCSGPRSGSCMRRSPARRLDHHAAQAQPGDLRRSPVPGGPGAGRRGPGRDAVRTRAGRPGVEGRVAGGPRRPRWRSQPAAGSASRMLDTGADPAASTATVATYVEPVALADRLGKHSAHDSVYAAAMHGIDKDQDFRTALRGDARLDAMPTPNSMSCWRCGPRSAQCAAFVDRVQRQRLMAVNVGGQGDRGRAAVTAGPRTASPGTGAGSSGAGTPQGDGWHSRGTAGAPRGTAGPPR